MRFGLVFSALAVMAAAIPAAAMQGTLPAPVYVDDEAEPAQSSEAASSTSVRLYRALEADERGEAVDRLLTATITELDVDCPQVEDYQVFRVGEGYRSLKVKCRERPLYAITVGPYGIGLVSGGDGSIEAMRPTEGPIYSVMGIDGVDYLEGRRMAAAAADRARRTGSAALDSVGGAGLVIFALFALTAAAIVFLAVRRARFVSPWRGLKSEDKDRLLDEAEEIYPDIFRHPGGIWIARGRRGKRRLFSNLLFAYAYRTHGYKFFQIR